MRPEALEWFLDCVEEEFDSRLDWRKQPEENNPTKVFEWLNQVHSWFNFTTVEGDKVSRASNAELKRWCQNKTVLLNGVAVGPFDEMPEYVTSIVFHPKGKRRCTLR